MLQAALLLAPLLGLLGTVSGLMQVLRTLGHPYTDEDIAGAKAQLAGKTEQDALIAYLQVLGTSVKTR